VLQWLVVVVVVVLLQQRRCLLQATTVQWRPGQVVVAGLLLRVRLVRLPWP
jgi:hypothetical protein